MIRDLPIADVMMTVGFVILLAGAVRLTFHVGLGEAAPVALALTKSLVIAVVGTLAALGLMIKYPSSGKGETA